MTSRLVVRVKNSTDCGLSMYGSLEAWYVKLKLANAFHLGVFVIKKGENSSVWTLK